MKKIVLLASALLCLSAFGQNRPSVGVVLSGGGAKGFAHIGVLEILDSLGIPVDAIGGTSMGSIVGGLYAIGHTPRELSDIATGTEWDFVTDPRPERKYLAPYEKSTHERYLIKLDITREGPKIPGGLNPGERILNLLSRYTVGYHDPLDFRTDLPIPFVCVATELNTGKEKVMYGGVLPMCLRSSMSIPSLFSPYYYDRTYLIDGGTVNNFPADHLKQIGADILIGVDVQTTFKDSISDPTFLKVMEKTSMYMNAFTMRERESLCDLIIQPDMTSFGVTTFDRAADIIESGRQAARAQMDKLLEIRRQLGGPQPRTVDRYLPPDRVAIDEIRIKGLEYTNRRKVMGNLGFSVGDTVTFDQIEQGMLRLHGTNQYSLANYLIYEFMGQTVLEIRVLEKPSRIRTNIGIRYDRDFESAAVINITSRNGLFSGSYFSTDLVIGENPRILATYLWDNGALPGFGLDLRYWNYSSDLILEDRRLGEYRTSDLLSRFYVTSSLGKSTSVRLGGAYHKLSGKSSIGQLSEIIDTAGFRDEYLELFFSSMIDIRDRGNYPTRGIMMDLEVKGITPLSSEFTEFPLVGTLLWESNIPVSPRWTLRPTVFGMLSVNSVNLTTPYTVNYGGLGRNYINNNQRFYGYRFSSAAMGYRSYDETSYISGLNSAMMALDIQYEIFKNNFVTVGVNGAVITDDLTDPVNPALSAYKGGFMGEYGLNTFIGPISVAVHRSFERNDWIGYVNIGYWF